MLDRPNVTKTLAQFIARLQPGDIPAEVTHQAKRSFMNFFAVALAGCRTVPIEIALAAMV